MQCFEASPWISWQTYAKEDSKFIVVSDSVKHTFGVIEGENADLWTECFSDSKSRQVSAQSLLVHAQFIAALKDEGLIRDSGYHLPESISQQAPAPIYLSNDATETDLAYQTLEQEIKSKVESMGKLWTFFWETTYACNEKCIHCFNPGASHGPEEKSTRSTASLDRERIQILLDDLREIGVFRIVFSGGEFFIHKDWEYILSEAHKRNFELHIFTNGLLLDDDRLDRLCSYWPQSVSVSIYSHDPEVHDKITRTPFSHYYSIKALNRLRERGIKTTIKCPIMNTSAQGIRELVDLGKAVGARVAFDAMISAGNDGNTSPIVHNSSWMQLLMLSLDKYSPIYVGNRNSGFGAVDKNPDLHVCGAGRSIMSMTPDGRITPCCALPIEVANLREDRIKDVWEAAISSPSHANTADLNDIEQVNLLKNWRSVKLRDYYECGTHDRCSWCNKCPGGAFNETGDVLKASMVQCKIASARMSIANLLEANTSREAIMEMICSGMIIEPKFEIA